MKLGELALNIETEEEEKLRISEFLQDKDSLPFYILKHYALKSEQFKTISRSFRKRIRGFRPGNDLYYSQAIKIILKDLSSNTAPDIGWDTYQSIVIEYLNNEKPSFQELMSDITVEPEIEGTTQNIFSRIFENSYAYGVEMSDIKDVYEAWPFPRIDNFEELAAKHSNPDLPVRNKRLLKETEKRIEELKKDLEERRGVAKNNQKSIKEINSIISSLKNELFIDVDIKINKFQKEILVEISSINKKIDSKSNLAAEEVVEIKSKIETVEQALPQYKTKDACEIQVAETTKHINNNIREVCNIVEKNREEFNKYVDNKNCKLNIESLVGKIEKSRIDTRDDIVSNIVEKVAIKDNIFFDKYLQKKYCSVEKRDVVIEEPEFLECFSRTLKNYSIDQSSEDTVVQHTIMKDSSVIFVNDKRLYNSWLASLGWEEYVTKISISPSWSSPNDWGKEILELTNENLNAPYFLEIHDFDVGLFESYLIPILKLWHESRGFNPNKKIVLLPSNQKRYEDLLILSEYARCVDVFYNESTLDKNIKYLIGKSKLSNEVNINRVSQECLTSWSGSIGKTDNILTKKFINDCQKEFEDAQVEYTFHIYEGIPETISRNILWFENNKKTYDLFVKTFTAPWIDIVNEIK